MPGDLDGMRGFVRLDVDGRQVHGLLSGRWVMGVGIDVMLLVSMGWGRRLELDITLHPL